VQHIQAIAAMRDRIKLTRQDARKFLASGVCRWPKETLIYLDPPYYVKGRDLYYDFYEEKDHAEIANFVMNGIDRQRWIVSYDNVPRIRELYRGARHVVYNIGYSARSASQGSEVMFFCDDLRISPLIGPVQITEDHANIYTRMA
jgi:DNA adenine methylase